MPPAPKTLTIPLNRSTRPGQWEAYTANPLRLSITSAEAPLSGITEIRAELHPQRLTMGQAALAVATVSNPSGYSATINFTAAQLNQDLAGAPRRSFWLLLRVILEDATTDIYELGTLDLLAHPASDTVSPPPEVAIFATTTAVSGAVAAEATARTASLAVESAARVSGDTRELVNVGDSVSSPETNALGDMCWTRQFARIYQPFAGAQLVNLAVPGRTAQADAAAQQWLAHTAPVGGGLVTIEFSTNDLAALRSAAQVVADLQTISNGWRGRGYKTCVLSAVRYGAYGTVVDEINASLRAATWYDYFADVTSTAYDLLDYVHPSAKGSTTIATQVAAALANGPPTDVLVSLPISIVKNITSTATGNPAVVTATGHGLTSGQLVYISGSSGAAVNGVHAVTVTGVNTFTIPVNVASGETGGTLNTGVSLFRGNRQPYQRTSWMIHMNEPGGGDMEQMLGAAMYGYGTGNHKFALTLINGVYVFNTAGNLIRGVSKLTTANTLELYLVNLSIYYSYTVTARELFAS